MSELEFSGAVVSRGGLEVIHGIDLVVPAGEVTVLLGGNGSGKTTLLEAASGILPLTRGSITLEGKPIHKLRRDARSRRGLAHIEQGRTIFETLSVEENILVAGGREPSLEELFGLFPALAARRRMLAIHLSGGERQMLVIARALAGRPRVLLIDELSLGLAPSVIHKLTRTVSELAAQGIGILLVEQFATLALSVGTTAYVLSRGRLAYRGPCEELRASPELLHAAYLGESRYAA